MVRFAQFAASAVMAASVMLRQASSLIVVRFAQFPASAVMAASVMLLHSSRSIVVRFAQFAASAVMAASVILQLLRLIVVMVAKSTSRSALETGVTAAITCRVEPR